MKLQDSNRRIKTFLGFAIKSGKIVFGTDNLLLNNKVKLILTDKTLSENAKEKLLNRAKTLPAEIFEIENLETLVSKVGVKAVGVTDTGMSNEIIKSISADK